MSLSVRGLSKSYVRDRPALREVSLDVAEGELLAIVGPSGSGKSTLLRCVAGLETPDGGTVDLSGREITDVAPGDRDVAMIFQDLALYPHLSVRQNIAFPLLARKVARDVVKAKVDALAASLGLEDLLDRRPDELSGGERRRVAIARVVIREPQLFLMDEPLSNLDPQLKVKVQEELRDTQRRLGVATIYVTHDQSEAMALGERIAVMREGGVVQIGTPVELYDAPSTEWVARFFGRFPMNVMPGHLLGTPRIPQAGLRAEDVVLTDAREGRITARVKEIEILGPDILVILSSGDATLMAVVPRSFAGLPGDEFGIAYNEAALHPFGADGVRL